MGRLAAAPSLAEAVSTLLDDALTRYTAARRPAGCMILSGRVSDTQNQRKIVLKLRERRSRQQTAIAVALGRWLGLGESTIVSDYLITHLIGYSMRARDGAKAVELRRTVPMVLKGALAAVGMTDGE